MTSDYIKPGTLCDIRLTEDRITLCDIRLQNRFPLCDVSVSEDRIAI